MFPQFASTAASFTRASSLMLKAGTDAHLYDDPHDADIVTLLDSRFDVERVEALKRLLALTSQGFDVSSFFPQVVKNVASSSLEVKKLVYIYLMHYAEKRPDEALLSINTFQKDLVDFNPLVRAWALRAMCGIRVHAVAHLMMMAVQKCAKDPSPYVRQCAANAILKVYTLNGDYLDSLQELIGILLDDKSPDVLGAAAAAFAKVCPENYQIIAPRFHDLCNSLPHVEEWGQVLLLDILYRYVIACYGYDIKTETNGRFSETNNATELTQHGKERQLLLKRTRPLLWSQNSAVVLAAASCHWLLAPKAELEIVVKPLLFLMRSSYDSQYVVMANLATLVQEKPFLFEEFYEDFFIRSSDTQHVRAMKLDILALIATDSSIASILQELKAYVRDPDRKFAANAVRVIGKCAQRHPSVAPICMEGLLMLAKGTAVASETEVKKNETSQDIHHSSCTVENQEAEVVTQAVFAIKSLSSQHFRDVEKVLVRLICELDHIRVPAARAVVIWMVGEYCSESVRIRNMLPSLLSYVAACFANEDIQSKLQILSCIAKVVVQLSGEKNFDFKTALLSLLYVLDLGSCDANYDVRDRARMLKQLMSPYICIPSNGSSELCGKMDQLNVLDYKLQTHKIGENDYCNTAPALLAAYFLNKTKPLPVNTFIQQERKFVIGSMSHIVHHSAPGYRELPEPCSLEDTILKDLTVSVSDDLLMVSSELEPQEVGDGSEYSESDYSSSLSHSGSEDGDLGADNCLVQSIGSESPVDSKLCISQGTTFQLKEIEPLICLSDPETEANPESSKIRTDEGGSSESRAELTMRSSEDLETWLADDDTGTIRKLSQCPVMPSGLIKLSMDSLNIEPRRMTLLDYTNGEGLEVKYSFCFSALDYHHNMVLVKLYVTNRSTSDVLSAIYVKDWDVPVLGDSSSRFAIPSDEISSLHPGEAQELDLHVDFHQQLLPVKLAIHCNKRCYSVKLLPDIGAFLKPKVLTTAEFTAAEAKLLGMFEVKRRFYVQAAQHKMLKEHDEVLSLVKSTTGRVLSHINAFLVTAVLPLDTGSIDDDSWSVHLQFSGETLIDSKLCLISVVMEGRLSAMHGYDFPVTVKVNCEDSIFGPSLLKRLQEAITTEDL